VPGEPCRLTGARNHALVFPGERGTPFKPVSARPASGVSDWWLHDLRRTLATGLQRLGVRLQVTEALLNHLRGSRAGVVGIYQRLGRGLGWSRVDAERCMALASADDPEEALEEELVRLTSVGVALRERYRSWRSD
jgi:hypothetical protein